MTLDSKDVLHRADDLQSRVGTYLVDRGYKYVDDPISRRCRWAKKMGPGLEVRVFDYIHTGKPKVCPEVTDLSTGKYVTKMVVCSIITDESVAKFRATIDQMEAKAVEMEKTRCPHCGGIMGERTVKKEGEHCGKKFLGCLRWPSCRGVRAEWKKTVADDEGKWNDKVRCPDCGSPMVVRYAKKWPHTGNRFFGCTRYPNCKRIVEIEEATALMLMDEPPPPDPMKDLADNLASLNTNQVQQVNPLPPGVNPFGGTP